MLKVLLLIDCDSCRALFRHLTVASDDQTAWAVHGDNLAVIAEDQGWVRTHDGNCHYCSRCWPDVEQALVASAAF